MGKSDVGAGRIAVNHTGMKNRSNERTEVARRDGRRVGGRCGGVGGVG